MMMDNCTVAQWLVFSWYVRLIHTAQWLTTTPHTQGELNAEVTIRCTVFDCCDM